MEAFKGLWGVMMIGILVRDGYDTALAVSELVFLSITLELIHEGLRLHQHEYLESKLKQRCVVKGRASLPQIEEGRTAPVPIELRRLMWCREALEKAQEEVGSLQWLALKTRPDIAAAVAICVGMQTRDPQHVV